MSNAQRRRAERDRGRRFGPHPGHGQDWPGRAAMRQAGERLRQIADLRELAVTMERSEQRKEAFVPVSGAARRRAKAARNAVPGGTLKSDASNVKRADHRREETAMSAFKALLEQFHGLGDELADEGHHLADRFFSLLHELEHAEAPVVAEVRADAEKIGGDAVTVAQPVIAAVADDATPADTVTAAPAPAPVASATFASEPSLTATPTVLNPDGSPVDVPPAAPVEPSA